MTEDADSAPRKNAIVRFLRILGPGLVTGAADDDLAVHGVWFTIFGQ